MGEAKRTTKLKFDDKPAKDGGMNIGKKEDLHNTKTILNQARVFYCEFFLAHVDKLQEKVWYFSKKEQKEKERLISANELLTWAESKTVTTKKHPEIKEKWDFQAQFPDMPYEYRRSVIKDSIGRVRSYLSNLKNWEEKGQARSTNSGKSPNPLQRHSQTGYTRIRS